MEASSSTDDTYTQTYTQTSEQDPSDNKDPISDYEEDRPATWKLPSKAFLEETTDRRISMHRRFWRGVLLQNQHHLKKKRNDEDSVPYDERTTIEPPIEMHSDSEQYSVPNSSEHPEDRDSLMDVDVDVDVDMDVDVDVDVDLVVCWAGNATPTEPKIIRKKFKASVLASRRQRQRQRQRHRQRQRRAQHDSTSGTPSSSNTALTSHHRILKETTSHMVPWNDMDPGNNISTDVTSSPPLPQIVVSPSSTADAASPFSSSYSWRRKGGCRGLIFLGFVACLMVAVIGVGTFFYVFWIPQLKNSGKGFSTTNPPWSFDFDWGYRDQGGYPWAPSRDADQIASAFQEWFDFLSIHFNVTFEEQEYTSPNHQAVAWLVMQSQTAGTSRINWSNKDRLAQRFAMISLRIHWFSKPMSTDPEKEAFWKELFHDECNWKGVTCDGKTVTEIVWKRQRLVGSIPSEIHILSDLKILDLAQNKLNGTIPEEVYGLIRLEELDLSQNEFTGTLSESLGNNLVALNRLQLNQNEFTGTIPNSMLGPEKAYRFVYLDSNNFTGTLPAGLGWKSLWYLGLSRNQLTGTLPGDLDRLVELQQLRLDNNQFSGAIPENIAGLGKLVTLSLNNNVFTGAVPSDWATAENLSSLVLHQNNFTVPLSASMCDMSAFASGDIVEVTVDCEICSCKDSTVCHHC